MNRTVILMYALSALLLMTSFTEEKNDQKAHRPNVTITPCLLLTDLNGVRKMKLQVCGLRRL